MRSILTTTALVTLALFAVPAAAAKPDIGDFGFDTAGMDRSVPPGEDFYMFANGTWNKDTVIPADKARFGAFDVLSDRSLSRSRSIIEAAAKAGPAGDADAQKVGAYYTAYMDEAGIEARGLKPLQPMLAQFAAITTRAQLAEALGALQQLGVPTPIRISVQQDPKAPQRYMVDLRQGGIGLPDRDYFLVDTPKFADTRDKYRAHIAIMFRLAGLSEPEVRAKAVFDLEHDIAQAQWTRIEQRDPVKSYNLRDVAGLSSGAPGFDWPAFLAAAGLGNETQFNATEPSAFAGFAKLSADRPLPVWRDYMTLRLLEARAGVLPKAIRDEAFAFNGTVLSGQPEEQPRWKRAVNATNGALGEAVGKLYVAQYFTLAAKVQADTLVANLRAAMAARIETLDWMSPATKAQAEIKLASFDPKIGYPSKWRDYTALKASTDDAFGNANRAQAFEYQRNLHKLGGPLDRTEWGMTPQTVNAYYNPPKNEIVFPAAILQAPFFDPNADPAVNYGGIGVVIGHEISHGFDDQGRQYDSTGTLRDWWTPEDAAKFKVRADRLIAQYDAYEVLPGTHIKGGLTLGENIADLAGLRISYDAYHLSLHGKPAPVIDGLTGDQRFFLGFAQVWRERQRDAALLSQVTSNPHSPGEQRASTVRNFDPWYAAFNPKPGGKLYLTPEQRVRIW
jgi:putative endopeptidase